MRCTTVLALSFLIAPQLYSQASSGARPPVAKDTGYAAMQRRGEKAMGVDQYTSTHKFDALENGGRIELLRDTDDSAGVSQIRQHIREIAQAFKNGDFTTPAMVHMQTVPGTVVMRAKRGVITYEPHDLPRGAELVIRTADPDAVRAIHEFMAFQRGEHHAGGMSHP